MRQARRAAVVVLAAAAAAVCAVLLAGRSGHGRPPAPLPVAAKVLSPSGLRAPDIPAPPQLGIAVSAPEPLGSAGTAYWTAPVLRPVTARSAPDERAGRVAVLSPQTPEGTSNLVLVRGRRSDAHGNLWLRVLLPVLPNGTTGWIPRRTLGGFSVRHTRLVVDTRRLEATLFRDGRPVFRAPVGVGTPSAPTPVGQFYIRDRLAGYDDPFYGPIAFGTSARSAVLTDWPAGGFIGIHGTDRPDLIPGRISHGCIRMRNEDIVRLSRLMDVGSALTIR